MVHPFIFAECNPTYRSFWQNIRNCQLGLNAETGLITAMHPTLGNAADNSQFPSLLAHDRAIGVPGLIYTGDQAYDDTDLHVRLWE